MGTGNVRAHAQPGATPLQQTAQDEHDRPDKQRGIDPATPWQQARAQRRTNENVNSVDAAIEKALPELGDGKTKLSYDVVYTDTLYDIAEAAKRKYELNDSVNALWKRLEQQVGQDSKKLQIGTRIDVAQFVDGLARKQPPEKKPAEKTPAEKAPTEKKQEDVQTPDTNKGAPAIKEPAPKPKPEPQQIKTPDGKLPDLNDPNSDGVYTVAELDRYYNIAVAAKRKYGLQGKVSDLAEQLESFVGQPANKLHVGKTFDMRQFVATVGSFQANETPKTQEAEKSEASAREAILKPKKWTPSAASRAFTYWLGMDGQQNFRRFAGSDSELDSGEFQKAVKAFEKETGAKANWKRHGRQGFMKIRSGMRAGAGVVDQAWSDINFTLVDLFMLLDQESKHGSIFKRMFTR